MQLAIDFASLNVTFPDGKNYHVFDEKTCIEAVEQGILLTEKMKSLIMKLSNLFVNVSSDSISYRTFFEPKQILELSKSDELSKDALALASLVTNDGINKFYVFNSQSIMNIIRDKKLKDIILNKLPSLPSLGAAFNPVAITTFLQEYCVFVVLIVTP